MAMGTTGGPASAPPVSSMDVFVARQPIFGPDRQVKAYELLYRSSHQNTFDGTDGDTATSRLLVNAFLTLGIDTITGGRPAFVNFTRNALLQEFPTLLPPDRLVIEVLEDVEPDEQVVTVCRNLKALGYTLALDDIISLDRRYDALLELTDVVKVDWMLADDIQKQAVAQRCRPYRITMLAEKVESEEEFVDAVRLGYTLFQGYFFCRPNIIAGRDVPAAKTNYLRLLREVNSRDFDLGRIENVIKSELTLSYKLLKYLNSAAFGWRRQISSIKHALVAVGERELRKWMSVLCLTQMADDKPPELALQSLVRAHFCEQMGSLVGMADRSTDLFLAGLFSMLDTIMQRPLAECLEQVPIATEVLDALIEGKGRMRDILDGVVAYERGDWAAVRAVAEKLTVDPERVSETYLQAVKRADTLFATT